MAGSIGDPSRTSLRAEINVTPLVDVVLVLLIIFMVVTPLLTRGKPVQLPAAVMAVRGTDSLESVVLTITADKRLFLEARPVTQTELAFELSARPNRQLWIKADSSLSMRDLRPVLRRIKASGRAQIAFGVVPQRGEAAP
jgi:biopolymer transport protein ExbD